MGETGRGVAEHFGVLDEIDVITSTLGKALGGAAGEFVAASEEVCDLLSQRSRPQLFSNALPPTVACSALESVRVLRREPELVEKLRRNSATFRERLREIGYAPLEGDAAIIPIIVGETAFAIRFSERLLDEGVFVTGFGFPWCRGHGASPRSDVRRSRGRASRPGARRLRAWQRARLI
jgi:glycine C-acetyltransferase